MPPRRSAEDPEDKGARGKARTRDANEEGGRQTETERRRQQMRRRYPRRHDQRSTSGFSWARRAGPIPETASSSSSDWNAPCAVL